VSIVITSLQFIAEVSFDELLTWAFRYQFKELVKDEFKVIIIFTFYFPTFLLWGRRIVIGNSPFGW
jgi:hypothetical protein